MIPTKFVIHIAGPSCSGKSSVFKELSENLPEAYTISYDKMKWQITNYHRDKHKAFIKELVVGFFEVVCKKNIPIFLESFIESEEEYQKFKGVAEQNGYVFLAIETTAPDEVLLARFRKRVADVTRLGQKISVTDENIFLTQTSKRKFVRDGTPVFDTSLSTTEEIVKRVIDLLSAESK